MRFVVLYWNPVRAMTVLRDEDGEHFVVELLGDTVAVGDVLAGAIEGHGGVDLRNVIERSVVSGYVQSIGGTLDLSLKLAR